MNETFNWNRFKKVVAMDARGIWPRFGLSMLVLSLLPSVVWLFCLVLGKNGPDAVPPELRWGTILACGLLCAVMAPSRMYKNVNLPKKGVYFAMLPASHLEKFLSMMLFCIVVCPLAMLVCSIVVDSLLWVLPFGSYHQSLFAHGDWIGDWDTTMADPYLRLFVTPGAWILVAISSYLASVSSFMFTNTIFKKHKVIMTVLWVWLISFALELVTTPISLYFVSGLDDWWIEKLLDNWGNLENITLIYGLQIAANLVWSCVFLWWTGHRIKKMRY